MTGETRNTNSDYNIDSIKEFVFFRRDNDVF